MQYCIFFYLRGVPPLPHHFGCLYRPGLQNSTSLNSCEPTLWSTRIDYIIVLSYYLFQVVLILPYLSKYRSIRIPVQHEATLHRFPLPQAPGWGAVISYYYIKVYSNKKFSLIQRINTACDFPADARNRTRVACVEVARTIHYTTLTLAYLQYKYCISSTISITGSAGKTQQYSQVREIVFFLL